MQTKKWTNYHLISWEIGEKNRSPWNILVFHWNKCTLRNWSRKYPGGHRGHFTQHIWNKPYVRRKIVSESMKTFVKPDYFCSGCLCVCVGEHVDLTLKHQERLFFPHSPEEGKVQTLLVLAEGRVCLQYLTFDGAPLQSGVGIRPQTAMIQSRPRWDGCRSFQFTTTRSFFGIMLQIIPKDCSL